MVMAENAPDSSKSLEMYVDYISSVVQVLREGRKGGAKDFYITGDNNADLGLMCADDNDEGELTKLYGPFCWQRYDKERGGFKKKCGMGL